MIRRSDAGHPRDRMGPKAAPDVVRGVQERRDQTTVPSRVADEDGKRADSPACVAR